MAWDSHDLLSEILKRAAGEDISNIKVAGLILLRRKNCWAEFLRMADDEPLSEWALSELAKWVKEGDGAPEVLKLLSIGENQ